MKQVANTGFLLRSFFDPKYDCEMFFRNVGWLSTDYTAYYAAPDGIYTLVTTGPERVNSINQIFIPKAFLSFFSYLSHYSIRI
jgi:hypothetical protein